MMFSNSVLLLLNIVGMMHAADYSISWTVDNFGKIYLDGILAGENGHWPTAITTTVPHETEVVAFELVKYNGASGFVASYDWGGVPRSTDNYTEWVCTADNSSFNALDWTLTGYNDSSWETPDAFFRIGDGPWTKRPFYDVINRNALWIWLHSSSVTPVWCRHVLSRQCHPVMNKMYTRYKKCHTHTYSGCFVDSSIRDLSYKPFGHINVYHMTWELCVEACGNAGYIYAGLQHYGECFCDNFYGAYGSGTDCDTPCNGNTEQICGGGWRNSILQINNDCRNYSQLQHYEQPSCPVKGCSEIRPYLSVNVSEARQVIFNCVNADMISERVIKDTGLTNDTAIFEYHSMHHCDIVDLKIKWLPWAAQDYAVTSLTSCLDDSCRVVSCDG